MSSIFFNLKTHEQKDGDDIQVEVYLVCFAYFLMRNLYVSGIYLNEVKIPVEFQVQFSRDDSV